LTETEPRPPLRALVASFLFTDLVGFSKGTTAEQYAAKSTLSAILRGNLAALRDADYRIKDTGDGALITFTSSPEHALYMALAIAQDFGRAAAEAGFPSNSLRTGLHLGTVKESIDLEARPNYIGDGINAAKRIMDFATPGQITASRAFFDAVASLDSAYAALFTHVGAADDKHGRSHDFYAISPSSTVLEKLKLDLVPAVALPAEMVAKHSATIGARQGPSRRATDAAAESSPAVSAVRKWLIPGGAVIALGVAALVVGMKIIAPSATSNRSPGPSAPAASSTSGVPAATSASAPAPTISTPTVAPPTTAERTSVESQTSAAMAPKAAPSTAVPVAPAAKSASVPDVTPPASAAAVAAAKTNANIKPRTDVTPSASAPANAVSDRSSPRCSRIMEKATLGETLSIEEKRELASSCR
jgi:Adenylate and Guanylate cyclase catalytic domain